MSNGERLTRLAVYQQGGRLELSDIMPTLEHFGIRVIEEVPTRISTPDDIFFIHDFGVLGRDDQPLDIGACGHRVTDTIQAVLAGNAESDSLSRLIISAGLDYHQVNVLRAYRTYWQRVGSGFTTDYINDAFAAHPEIAAGLIQLFEARFDPDHDDWERESALINDLSDALDAVASLDEDRILRGFLALILATVRTNAYQERSSLSFKFDSPRVPNMPPPAPFMEIFVFAPSVEGVHLRGGAVARGGIRWSVRREDYRTEVLGLMKAQMTKNAVIVPTGSKGGFVLRHPGADGPTPDQIRNGYITFIRGLLDITDNLVDGEVVHPARVRIHDGPDPYLVVAADRGTATFSDTANELAAEYGFWLGDAFASGGSAGYDHKAMGITARGAWVSVRRHFREMGIDCQNEDFTCVGVGDMSGDVFGNGMLLSEHIRLVAAFDHRDIFLDPDPDAASSYAERRRLFDTPRSSWQDYDKSLISEGGGVYSRALKSIKITPQVRRALSLPDDVKAMTPAELMRAILLAKVDLLWNGGIGTYVKGRTETNADAGDKANDPIRVDGAELRCRCVGEGGNLGFTQRGRIEYALAGGRITTDFIDNSAGVDTSDHEVNIKILLDRVVSNGDLTGKQRNDLLASMTDEVGELVLLDNYEQNLAIATAEAQAVPLLHVHEDWTRRLEKQGLLNRELEFLPSRKQVADRRERGLGLTAPELSVLLAYTKIVLADELIQTDLPDDPFLRSDLFRYFPSKMRQAYRQQMEEHPLRREIIVTQIVNALVNGAGITYFHRLSGETGASAAEITRANFVAREIFGSTALLEEIASYDNKIDAAVQTKMRIEVRTLVERASRWLINNRRPPLDSEAIVDFFDVDVQRVMAGLPELMTGREHDAYEERRKALAAASVPDELATKIAGLPQAYAALGVVETAQRDQIDALDVARVHFALGERLGLTALTAQILRLPRDDRWQTMARAALRDELQGVHAQLTAQVLAETSDDQPVPVRIADWEEDDEVVVSRAVSTLDEICSDDRADLARLSVGLRVVRTLLATP